MTTYAPSSATVGVSISNGTVITKTDWLIPALLVGGGVVGAVIIVASNKKEKK